MIDVVIPAQHVRPPRRTSSRPTAAPRPSRPPTPSRVRTGDARAAWRRGVARQRRSDRPGSACSEPQRRRARMISRRASPLGGEAVLDVRRDHRIDGSQDEPVRLQLPQLLRQHALRDVAELALERVEADRPLHEVIERQPLPLAADDLPTPPRPGSLRCNRRRRIAADDPHRSLPIAPIYSILSVSTCPKRAYLRGSKA